MKNLLVIASMLVLLAACQSAAPAATATPAPPTTTPIPPTGITGSVSYSGSANGGILILALDHAPAQNENPAPVAIETYSGSSGDFTWELPAGTYFITAFFTIDREPQGPPLPNEPVVFCDPVQVSANETVHLEIVLTDADAGGSGQACVVGS